MKLCVKTDFTVFKTLFINVISETLIKIRINWNGWSRHNLAIRGWRGEAAWETNNACVCNPWLRERSDNAVPDLHQAEPASDLLLWAAVLCKLLEIPQDVSSKTQCLAVDRASWHLHGPIAAFPIFVQGTPAHPRQYCNARLCDFGCSKSALLDAGQ